MPFSKLSSFPLDFNFSRSIALATITCSSSPVNTTGDPYISRAGSARKRVGTLLVGDVPNHEFFLIHEYPPNMNFASGISMSPMAS